jgi:hypothetical protein
MKVNTDTGIISAQGYMEEELSNELSDSIGESVPL